MSVVSASHREISLILFDIDGTLMITKGASSRCMKRAGQIVLGSTFAWHPVTVGTLDPQIFDQLAKANGITPTDTQRRQYEKVYLDLLERELNARREDITLLPGIAGLIESLHKRSADHGDVLLGVLTGNFRRAAELKLELSGLGLERFPIMTCAEHGGCRNDLPRIAIELAQYLAGQPIVAAQTYIVGDTPRDIECAKANGCVSVSVATGHYSVDQLMSAGSGLVMESLADPTPLLELLG